MEKNRIYNENCLDTMKRMPNNFIDLTVTSPPYDDLRDYDGYSLPVDKIIEELFRVTKDGGVVVWVVGDQTKNGSESGTSFKQALYFKWCGFNIHDTMIYRTNKPPLTHNRYEQEFEFMFVFSKGKPKTFNPILEDCNWAGTGTQGTFRQDATGRLEKAHNKKLIGDKKIKGNIWNIPSGKGKGTLDDVFEHPATFPEKLAADHIHSWSNEGDLIYDCFMGSGTTAKMAHIYKRDWIGSEMSENYIKIAEKRLKKYLSQTALF